MTCFSFAVPLAVPLDIHLALDRPSCIFLIHRLEIFGYHALILAVSSQAPESRSRSFVTVSYTGVLDILSQVFRHPSTVSSLIKSLMSPPFLSNLGRISTVVTEQSFTSVTQSSNVLLGLNSLKAPRNEALGPPFRLYPKYLCLY